MSNPTHQVAIRLAHETIARIDTFAERHAAPLTLSRSDAIRVLLELALAQVEREAKGRRR